MALVLPANEQKTYVVHGTLTFVLDNNKPQGIVDLQMNLFHVKECLKYALQAYPWQMKSGEEVQGNTRCPTREVSFGGFEFDLNGGEGQWKFPIDPAGGATLRKGKVCACEVSLAALANDLSRMNIPNISEVRYCITISREQRFPAIETETLG